MPKSLARFTQLYRVWCLCSSLASSVPLNTLCSGDIRHLSAPQTGMFHLHSSFACPGPSSWVLATPTTPYPQPLPHRGCSSFSSGLRHHFPTAACLEPHAPSPCSRGTVCLPFRTRSSACTYVFLSPLFKYDPIALAVCKLHPVSLIPQEPSTFAQRRH